MDINSVIRWFDPNASVRATNGTAYAAGVEPPPVWAQYVAFTLGVFASPLIRDYRAKGTWPKLTVGSTIAMLVFSPITGFVAFPKVIDSLSQRDAPWFARLSTIFTAGLGWEQLSGLPSALRGSAVSGG